MMLTKIETLSDVREFVRILMEEEHLNFHPDTPFEDYIFNESGNPFYSQEQATLRNRLLNDCFELGDRLGVDTHELMCDVGFSFLKGVTPSAS